MAIPAKAKPRFPACLKQPRNLFKCVAVLVLLAACGLILTPFERYAGALATLLQWEELPCSPILLSGVGQQPLPAETSWRAGHDPQAELPCEMGSNRAKPMLCPMCGSAPQCLSFTGDCSTPMQVDCQHMKSRGGNDKAAAVVVTAFWHLRPDRPLDQWRTWLHQVHQLNAELVSFVPAALAPDLRKARAEKGQENKTCVIEMSATQLPYGYLLPEAQAMLKRLVHAKPVEYGQWNWDSPEMTNPTYVLLQAGKVAVLDAVRQLGISQGRPLVWVDAGLARHAPVQTARAHSWPASEQLAQLDRSRIYLSSWAGYAPMAYAVGAFCAAPCSAFLRNRNHLSGTTVLVPEAALEAIFPAVTLTVERMVREGRWNNEQVVWELLLCFYPALFGVIDTRHVLFEELRRGFGTIPAIVHPPGRAAGPRGLCGFWGGGASAEEGGGTESANESAQPAPSPPLL